MRVKSIYQKVKKKLKAEPAQNVWYHSHSHFGEAKTCRKFSNLRQRKSIVQLLEFLQILRVSSLYQWYRE